MCTKQKKRSNIIIAQGGTLGKYEIKKCLKQDLQIKVPMK